ncbi:hypothetical protein AGMMS49543_21110 [Betaproteobacteria bacterium]|nr:hypothetical protein AGMMS49543_21110 [Betaproteobacteria bacterium]GHU21117.1 hypothetical protein AGMMS50243_17970 [Betaproteobacteria bacterium]
MRQALGDLTIQISGGPRRHHPNNGQGQHRQREHDSGKLNDEDKNGLKHGLLAEKETNMGTMNTALSIVIGGAVGASLGQAIARTKNDLGGLQKRLDGLNADRAGT